MATDWIEVTISSDADAGELLGVLNDPVVTGAWQEDGAIHLYWPSDLWSGETLTRLRQVSEQFGILDSRIVIDRLPERDWNAEWARQVKPIRIGRRVLIRPSWEPVALSAGEIELIIDPRQAFGTGHHATTQLMIGLLEELIHGSEHVLDVGTGSGILAMVALRLGASTAVGIDLDPVAIECAREYATINRFGPELQLLTVHRSANPQAGPFDLVLANLDRGTIVELGSTLIAYVKKGARLLLSGLLTEQRDDVIAPFLASGAGLYRQRERDGWVAIEVMLPESCEG